MSEKIPYQIPESSSSNWEEIEKEFFEKNALELEKFTEIIFQAKLINISDSVEFKENILEEVVKLWIEKVHKHNPMITKRFNDLFQNSPITFKKTAGYMGFWTEEDKVIQGSIVENSYGMVFHELLHAANLDNIPVDLHNLRISEGSIDTVYSIDNSREDTYLDKRNSFFPSVMYASDEKVSRYIPAYNECKNLFLKENFFENPKIPNIDFQLRYSAKDIETAFRIIDIYISVAEEAFIFGIVNFLDDEPSKYKSNFDKAKKIYQEKALEYIYSIREYSPYENAWEQIIHKARERNYSLPNLI